MYIEDELRLVRVYRVRFFEIYKSEENRKRISKTNIKITTYNRISMTGEDVRGNIKHICFNSILLSKT